MRLKGLTDEDFLQYKKPSMFIITSFCDFKCEKDCNCPGMCQNTPLAKAQIVEVADEKIVNRYLSNDITKAIVFGGLEPLDQFNELYDLISVFREHTLDDIVIYTGYYEDEITEAISKLSSFENILVKFGRYIPNQKPHYDEVLGIELASDNQYAKKIN